VPATAARLPTLARAGQRADGRGEKVKGRGIGYDSYTSVNLPQHPAGQLVPHPDRATRENRLVACIAALTAPRFIPGRDLIATGIHASM
jgi:hypothetical protein